MLGGSALARTAWRPARTRAPSTARLAGGEHAAHELDAAGLGQRLVEVAALRRLHAGRAALLARALADEAVRVVDQRLEGEVAAPGDADPAPVPVVDEDRRPAGL